MEEQIIKWAENIIPLLLSHGIKILIVIIGSFLLYKISNKVVEKTIRAAIVPGKFVSKTAEKKR